MIRQNRAVPILLVLTFAFLLYLGGCFDGEQTTTAVEDTPTPVPTSTAAPVVTNNLNAAALQEEPFYHTVESGDRLNSIASKYNVNPDVILRANPQMDPNLIIAGEKLLIPGAGTNPEIVEDIGPDRADGIVSNYLIQPGDTLGQIASTWTVSLESILETNPEVDAASLQVNQLIVIPAWGTGIDPTDLQPRSTPVPLNRQPGDPPIEHVVAAGDFISAIAERYNVNKDQIVEANLLEDAGNNIQIGQELLIPPPKAPEPTPTPANALEDSSTADN